MANYYCEYCGYKLSSVEALTRGLCVRHPLGVNKGHHKLYEGSEKKQYVCKYCGYKMQSIDALTRGVCLRHPNGQSKGHHSPAL